VGRALCIAITLSLILVASGGCAAPQSTRLTASDYSYTSNETANRLASSDFLANRNSASQRIIVTVEKVQNLTTDIISEGEQWMYVLGVRDSLPMQTLSKDKNLVFQVSPERLQMLHENGYGAVTSGWEPATHLLSATFHSATRTKTNSEGFVDQRTDQYQLEYSITNIKTGEVQWNSIVEFKRTASGNSNN
jgi:hypothetical protein